MPGDGATLAANKYVNSDGADTAGKAYTINVITCDKTGSAQCTNTVSGALASGVLSEMAQNASPRIVLVKKAKCGDNQGTAKASAGNRDYAILGQLESGVYCQDNV